MNIEARKNKLDAYIENTEFLKTACKVAEEGGYKLFIVGGFVRDFLLDRERDEIDFLVVGNGVEFAQKYAEKLGIGKVVVYKNFGTAQFSYKGWIFEFVGARKESYRRDSRKPIVEEGTFEDDINRRDFTINTLAVSLNIDVYGKLIDTFDAISDIRSNLIRTPLNPELTFDDDPLRILRAFRFASQLTFQVHDTIINAAKKMRQRLSIVSQERITDEFLKILNSTKPSIGLKLLYTTGTLRVIFPEAAEMGGVDQREEYHHKDVFYHTCEVVDNVACQSDRLWLRFAALVHDIGKPATKKFIEGTGWTFHGHEEIGARMMKGIFRRLKLPYHQRSYIEKLIRLHLRPIALVDDEVTDSAIRRLIVQAGEDLDDLITLCRADITSKNRAKVTRYLENYDKVMQKVNEVKEKDKLREFQSPVRGDEIMNICGIGPSKKVGDIKKAIEEAILEGEIKNTYEDAYNYLQKIKDQYC